MGVIFTYKNINLIVTYNPLSYNQLKFYTINK